MDPDVTYRVSVTSHGEGVARCVLSGELDLANARAVEEVLAGVVASGVDLELDLAGVSFLDSTTIRVLLLVGQTAREQDSAMRVVAASDHVARILTVAGLLEYFGVTGAPTGPA